MKKGLPKVVFVEWIDSVGTAGVDVWTDIEEVRKFKLCRCLSIGWLFEDNNEFIVIVPHIGLEDDDVLEENQVSGAMLIPKCSIASMRFITMPAASRTKKSASKAPIKKSSRKK